MDDRIRVSDADRDRVTSRLRDHFAAGRLTHGELDERISAALNAKTFGELRRVMADLPEPAPVPPRGTDRAQWGGPPWVARRHRPRFLPLALFVLIAALLLPGGGWLLPVFFRLILLLWLAACLAGVVFGRSRRTHHYR